MFNQLNNIRFPTQGKYMYTPPDSQHIDMKYIPSPSPQSIPSFGALQSRTNILLGQAAANLEQNRATDVRNANTVAGLSNTSGISGTGFNLVGNQTLTESSRNTNLQRGLLNFKLKAAQNSRSGPTRPQ